jgi:hypothetical protein
MTAFSPSRLASGSISAAAENSNYPLICCEDARRDCAAGVLSFSAMTLLLERRLAFGLLS